MFESPTPSDPPLVWVERQAKLFEAGEYPDKGLTITEAQLAALSRSFSEPVPVLIEHADSPLQLGFLTQVRHRGNELFGTVQLSRQANDLIEHSGARALSLGLTPEMDRIIEVSLVRNPRVPTAQLYSQAPRMEGAIIESDGQHWRKQYEAIQAQCQAEEADRRLQEWVRKGKLTPAQVPFARELLLKSASITFGEAGQAVAALLGSLLDRQPALALFGEVAPELPAEDGSHLMLPEEAAFYQRYFPEISLEAIAQRRPTA